MTKPLALVFYERLMPGSQLVNRLQDIGYRVSTSTDITGFVGHAQKEGPMVIFMDLTSDKGDVNGVIKELKGDNGTAHIPIIAFTSKMNIKKAQNAAVEAGAKLVAVDEAILPQLPQLLEQALEMD